MSLTGPPSPVYANAMNYRDYLLELLPIKGVTQETYGEAKNGSNRYPLIVLSIPGPNTVYIFTGFHGDELGGPLTMVSHLAEVFEYAKSKKVGLRVYPCINPAGTSEGHRYGGDQKQNNYFFQYKLPDGKVVAELPKGAQAAGVVKRDGMPEESVALALDLAKQPRPMAVLDLHQDGTIHGRRFYVYTYDKRPLLPIMSQCLRVAAPAKNVSVSTGGDVTPRKTDQDGFVLDWHDGSFTDWLHLQGVPYVVTLETAVSCHSR